jgi:hypothetical protein
MWESTGGHSQVRNSADERGAAAAWRGGERVRLVKCRFRSGGVVAMQEENRKAVVMMLERATVSRGAFSRVDM